jgi:hypothetical protein
MRHQAPTEGGGGEGCACGWHAQPQSGESAGGRVVRSSTHVSSPCTGKGSSHGGIRMSRVRAGP